MSCDRTRIPRGGLPPFLRFRRMRQQRQSFSIARWTACGVWRATLVRWFNDNGKIESATKEFLDARIENVMQFEKLKAQLRERAKDLPSLSDILGRFSARS